MSEINVLDRTGDTTTSWNPNNPDEVALARQAFDAAKAKKMLTYKANADGSKGELIREFDPSAERIVCTPQNVGG
jgi:hypothetical protein